MPINFKTPINDSSMKTLAGVRVWPVSTIVTTDTRVASGVALYNKASILDWMAVLLEITLISFLKIKGYHRLRGHSVLYLIWNINEESGRQPHPSSSFFVKVRLLRPYDSVWKIIPNEVKLDSLTCSTYNNERLFSEVEMISNPLSSTLRVKTITIFSGANPTRVARRWIEKAIQSLSSQLYIRVHFQHYLLSICWYFLTDRPVLRLWYGLYETLTLFEKRNSDWLIPRSKAFLFFWLV